MRNNDSLSKKIAKEFENTGQNVRKYYQKRLPSNPVKDYYYVLRDTANNESIIVEYGFLDSTGDDVEQIKNDYEKLAEAVVKAVSDYLGVNYVKPNNNTYIVKSGDTLWSIAKKYNVSIEDLKKENNLNTNFLKINQVLTIPTIVEKSNYYTVKKGDTLYSIAQNNKTTIKSIKELNNLSTNILYPGQKLLLKEVTTQKYIVKKGDNLWNIAKVFNTTVNELMKLNNLSTSNLSIGQELVVS